VSVQPAAKPQTSNGIIKIMRERRGLQCGAGPKSFRLTWYRPARTSREQWGRIQGDGASAAVAQPIKGEQWLSPARIGRGPGPAAMDQPPRMLGRGLGPSLRWLILLALGRSLPGSLVEVYRLSLW
jgi:hypothetical protein